MSYQHIKVPTDGDKITVNADFSLNVSDQPIIPFIEGDGTGIDITPVMIKVVDAAVEKAYAGKKKIHWMEIYVRPVHPGRFLAGVDFHPVDFLLARVRFLDRGIHDLDHHRRDVDTRAVALDERDDWLVGNVERKIGVDGDLVTIGRNLDVLIRHDRTPEKAMQKADGRLRKWV